MATRYRDANIITSLTTPARLVSGNHKLYLMHTVFRFVKMCAHLYSIKPFTLKYMFVDIGIGKGKQLVDLILQVNGISILNTERVLFSDVLLSTD